MKAGLREAEVVVEATYRTHVAHHNCLEPHGCTAAWEGDRLTLWDSTQSVFDVRSRVAEALDLPEHHVRVVKQFMGGGFGSKQIAWKHDVIAALLSLSVKSVGTYRTRVLEKMSMSTNADLIRYVIEHNLRL